jgi:uncharacterized protein
MRLRMLTTIAACAFASLLSPPPASAQTPAPAPAAPAPPAAAPPADADPALWVVRDADTIIYLFGTFHLLDGRPWFNDEVRTAFDASDELVLEAVIPDNPAAMQPLIMRYAVDPNGRTLSSRLTPAQNAKLGQALSAAGIPANAFDRFEPWFASMTLAVLGAQRLGVGTADGPETVLMRAARERRIPIGQLEGMEWQMIQLDTMPEAQQIAGLIDTIEKNDELDEKLAPMLAAWSSGDAERLGALINEGGAEDPALHELLFTRRNAQWASWIQLRLRRPGTVFVAVGAGHLAGNDSVQAALHARGVAAERVPHAEAN